MLNLPNILSFSRIIATIPLILLILEGTANDYLIAFLIFVLAALSDTFDGRLARKYHLVSNLGIFLDTTADKIHVTGLLIILIQVKLVPAWIVLVIIAREFLITGLRSFAAAEGLVIPAGRWGKQKTAITLVAIGAMLLAKSMEHGGLLAALGLEIAATPLLLASIIGIYLALVWTVASGVGYIINAAELLSGKPRSPTTTSPAASTGNKG